MHLFFISVSSYIKIVYMCVNITYIFHAYQMCYISVFYSVSTIQIVDKIMSFKINFCIFLSIVSISIELEYQHINTLLMAMNILTFCRFYRIVKTFKMIYSNTGIKHDFPFINIRKVPREVLKTEGEGPEGGVENRGRRSRGRC